MSPQKNYFNGTKGIWNDLEGKVRTWGRSSTFRDTLYVVKGGTIDKENQIWTYIGGDKSKPVPKYYLWHYFVKRGKLIKPLVFG